VFEDRKFLDIGSESFHPPPVPADLPSNTLPGRDPHESAGTDIPRQTRFKCSTRVVL
jgi:hypothetical protein